MQTNNYTNVLPLTRLISNLHLLFDFFAHPPTALEGSGVSPGADRQTVPQ